MSDPVDDWKGLAMLRKEEIASLKQQLAKALQENEELREDIADLEQELRMADAAIEKWQEHYSDLESKIAAA